MKLTLFIVSLLLFVGISDKDEVSADVLEKPIYFKGDLQISNTQQEIILFLNKISEASGGSIHMPHDYKSDRVFVLQQVPGQEKFQGKSRINNVSLTYFRNFLEVRKGKKTIMTFGLGKDGLHPEAQQKLEAVTRSGASVKPYLGIELAMMPKVITNFGTYIAQHPISIYQNKDSDGGSDCSKSQEFPSGGPGAISCSMNENTVYCLEEFNACSSQVEARCCSIATTPGSSE